MRVHSVHVFEYVCIAKAYTVWNAHSFSMTVVCIAPDPFSLIVPLTKVLSSMTSSVASNSRMPKQSSLGSR